MCSFKASPSSKAQAHAEINDKAIACQLASLVKAKVAERVPLGFLDINGLATVPDQKSQEDEYAQAADRDHDEVQTNWADFDNTSASAFPDFDSIMSASAFVDFGGAFDANKMYDEDVAHHSQQCAQSSPNNLGGINASGSAGLVHSLTATSSSPVLRSQASPAMHLSPGFGEILPSQTLQDYTLPSPETAMTSCLPHITSDFKFDFGFDIGSERNDPIVDHDQYPGADADPSSLGSLLNSQCSIAATHVPTMLAYTLPGHQLLPNDDINADHRDSPHPEVPCNSPPSSAAAHDGSTLSPHTPVLQQQQPLHIGANPQPYLQDSRSLGSPINLLHHRRGARLGYQLPTQYSNNHRSHRVQKQGQKTKMTHQQQHRLISRQLQLLMEDMQVLKEMIGKCE